MTAIVDAAPIVAAADVRDPNRESVQRVLREEEGELILPAQVSAEIDYLLRTRIGQRSSAAFLGDLARRRFLVACLDPEEYQDVMALDRRYADLGPGLADLSIVVLAKRFECRRLISFDERDFRAMTPLQGGTFKLLPADR